MSKKILKTAVIGVGNMGRHHARIYRELKDSGVDLAGVCDLDKVRGREVARELECDYFFNPTELFEAKKVDLVSIAVPTSHHLEVAQEALRHSANILLEKPAAGSLGELKQMAKLAGRTKGLFAVGHVERYNPGLVVLKKMIVDGKLGDIQTLVARRVGMAPPRDKSVGVTVDLAIHEVDAFYHLLGSLPRRYHCYKRTVLKGEGEDLVSLFLDYGFAEGFIQANWITPIKIRVLAVTGSAGYVELNYLTQELLVYEKTSLSRSLASREGFSEILKDEPRKSSHRVGKGEPLKAEITDIINCIRTGRKPRISFEEVYPVTKFVLGL